MTCKIMTGHRECQCDDCITLALYGEDTDVVWAAIVQRILDDDDED